MGVQAKSNLKKHLAAKRVHDAWMIQAISAYHLEQGRKCSKPTPCWGLCHICIELQDTCFMETGNYVKLSHMTLKHLVGGGKTHQQANVNQRWLDDGEENIVIAFIVEMADQASLSVMHGSRNTLTASEKHVSVTSSHWQVLVRTGLIILLNGMWRSSRSPTPALLKISVGMLLTLI
jgi:hypothetical protein